jgi:hypothetical protein
MLDAFGVEVSVINKGLSPNQLIALKSISGGTGRASKYAERRLNARILGRASAKMRAKAVNSRKLKDNIPPIVLSIEGSAQRAGSRTAFNNITRSPKARP